MEWKRSTVEDNQNISPKDISVPIWIPYVTGKEYEVILNVKIKLFFINHSS